MGAVAKGYATEQVCKELPSGYLVSVGGNVRATGPKPDGEAWVVGVQDPDGGAEDYLHTLWASEGSVVTSGDYQRYYYVDGVKVHEGHAERADVEKVFRLAAGEPVKS